jgi:hypothetical protein
VTVKLQEAVLPEVSVAVQVTVVVPCGKVDPDGGLQTTVATPQLSVATGAKVTTAGHAAFVMFAGHVMVGFSVSLTVTVKLHVAVLPDVSVAVQVTVVVPFWNVDPDGGLQLTETGPGQLSVAVGVV